MVGEEGPVVRLLPLTTNGHAWRISIAMMIWIIILQQNCSASIGQAKSRLTWRSYRQG
jgi:hypothetical protein